MPDAETVPVIATPIPAFSARKTVIKALTLTLLFLLIFILATAGVLSFIAYQKISEFTVAAGTDATELQTLVKDAWNTEPISANGHKTILLLGLDSLDQRGDIPPLTDTMMLLSVNLRTGTLHALSFPRDLWSESYQTKINALYYYGLERYPNSPEQFPTEVLSELTGIPIQHTVVLTLTQVAQLIDILGGVKVDVETGFTDTQFPRDDVDIHTVTDPDLLYKTITFEAGTQVLSGAQALEFMRSRHSGDDQGTDDARAARQQQVISGLIATVGSREFFFDPTRLGTLYKFYSNNFEESLSKKEVLSTAKVLFPYRDSIQLSRSVFPIFPENPQGVITHPQVTKSQPQWVYTVTDPVTFREHSQQSLGMEIIQSANLTE